MINVFDNVAGTARIIQIRTAVLEEMCLNKTAADSQ